MMNSEKVSSSDVTEGPPTSPFEPETLNDWEYI